MSKKPYDFRGCYQEARERIKRKTGVDVDGFREVVHNQVNFNLHQHGDLSSVGSILIGGAMEYTDKFMAAFESRTTQSYRGLADDLTKVVAYFLFEFVRDRAPKPQR